MYTYIEREIELKREERSKEGRVMHIYIYINICIPFLAILMTILKIFVPITFLPFIYIISKYILQCNILITSFLIFFRLFLSVDMHCSCSAAQTESSCSG